MPYQEIDRRYLKELTVLYVEDDPDVRRQFELFLNRRCGTVLSASNGREGLALFVERMPHVVITDIQMPVMDGLDMLAEIRKTDLAVPCIVTTAFEQPDYLMRSIDVGVDKYVIKPVIGDRLYEALVSCGRRLRQEGQLKLAAKVFEHSMEGILITDRNNRIIRVNPAFTAITGYGADEMTGCSPEILSSGYQDEGFFRAMQCQLDASGCWQGELTNRHKSGRVYPAWLSVTTLYDERGQVTNRIGIFADISDRKAAEEHLRNLALYDSLTGLANRSLLAARFELALAGALRNREQLGLLFIDLDNFKAINDTLGHSAGDEVLQEVARRLKGLFRASDTICRTGGDEFLVVVHSVTDQTDAARAAEKVIDALAPAMEFWKNGVSVTPSIGIAIYPRDGEDMDTLMRNADTAMYRAKQQGKNTYRFFSPMDASSPAEFGQELFRSEFPVPGSICHASAGTGREE